MATASNFSQYPQEETYVRWGTAGALGLHIAFAVTVLTIAWLTGVKSIEQLMKESGSPAVNPPPPEEQIEIELKDLLPPPPPVAKPEFAQQIVKAIPPPPKLIVIKKIVPKPPKPRPVVSAPAVVSRLVVGSGAFPRPGYPYQAMLRHETGTVLLSIHFDGAGTPSDVDVLTSSGYFDLDVSARNWIRTRWHDPSYANTSATVPINFVLQ